MHTSTNCSYILLKDRSHQRLAPQVVFPSIFCSIWYPYEWGIWWKSWYVYKEDILHEKIPFSTIQLIDCTMGEITSRIVHFVLSDSSFPIVLVCPKISVELCQSILRQNVNPLYHKKVVLLYSFLKIAQGITRILTRPIVLTPKHGHSVSNQPCLLSPVTGIYSC